MKTSRKGRTVRLQNFRTLRVIKARSMGEFCRKAGLNGTDKYHIWPVLEGKRTHHKGWGLPKTLNKRLTVRDVYGNSADVTVGQAIDRKLFGPCSIRRMNEGTTVLGGLRLASAPVNPYVIPPRSYRVKRITLRDTNGLLITGSSNQEVAKKAALSEVAVSNLRTGRISSIYGVTLHSIRTEQRSMLPV